MNYTDADEDAEKLMSFLDEVCCTSVSGGAKADIVRQMRHLVQMENRFQAKTIG